MDGAVELIDALAADGFLLAVGSSGPPENISLCLEKLGRREKFAAVVTGADVTRGKPDPQVFSWRPSGSASPPRSLRRRRRRGARHRGGQPRRHEEHRADRHDDSRARSPAADLVVDSLRELTPGNDSRADRQL